MTETKKSSKPKKISSHEKIFRKPKLQDSWRHPSNEQYVKDITLEFFYTPRSLTMMFFFISFLVYVAFFYENGETYDVRDTTSNIRLGYLGVSAVILMLSLLVFPNGPFIRPHPAVWRLVLGVSVLYLLVLVFLLFQNVDDSRKWLKIYISDELGVPLKQEKYAEVCELSWEVFKYQISDIFFLAHFFGWIIKGLMLNDFYLCWISSIMWEVTEITFIFMLPNFKECWWDSIVLDIIVCNGLGIYCGLQISKYLEMNHTHWTGIQSVPGALGKLKRAALQFTPASWTKVQWSPFSSIKRYVAAVLLVLGFQLTELNCFFLKHILWVPSPHWLNGFRLFLWSISGTPSIRQFYIYVTDPTCYRLGTQAWVTVAILATETLIVIKFGRGLFPEPMPYGIQVALVFGLISFVVFSLMVLLKIRKKTKSQ